MGRRRRQLGVAVAGAASLIGMCFGATAPANAAGPDGHGPDGPKVVATGLDNPRQLSFTASGSLLVAEAGEGGTGTCTTGPDGGDVCFGTTGAITQITSHGRQSRIVTGLPSLAAKETGAEATGPSDVLGTGRKVTILIGLGADPAVRASLPAAGRRLGTLVQTKGRSGKLRTIADVSAWEAKNNPVDDPDSNPVGMLHEHGRYVVADAGGNTVLRVGRRGGVRLLSAFEDRQVDAPPFLGLPPGAKVPMQAVPTSVATRGRDGAYYVSQLTGFPFPAGAANIYRIDRRTGERTVYASGLTNVTDLAFHHGRLYAVQLAANGLLNGPVGSVVTVKAGGTVPADHTVVAGDLPEPYGIAIRGHDAYITTHSASKDVGEVVRVHL